MATTAKTKLKVGDTVATKTDAAKGGVIKRIKGKNAYVMASGAKEPTEFALADLVKVTKIKASAAKAPAGKKPAKGAVAADMTPLIQVRAEGTLRGQNWQSIRREFKTVDEANEYLQQYKLKDVKGRDAKVEGVEATISANYDIEAILSKQAPDGDLPRIFFSEEKKPEIVIPKTERPEETKAEEPAPKKAKAKAGKAEKAPVKGDSNLVPLKEICRQLKIEPREARVKLRSLAKGNKLPIAHEAQGRWEWEPGQVEKVKALLSAD